MFLIPRYSLGDHLHRAASGPVPGLAGRRGFVLCGLAILAAAGAMALVGASRAQDADEPDPLDAKIQIHEWSFWIADPTLDQANQVVHFGTQMPGVVETDRSRNPASPKFKPLSVITVHGENCAEFELDLRVQGGRFVGHWPAAETKKSSRLRWIEMVLSAAKPADARIAEIDAKHWFTRAREGDGLYLKNGGRAERFIAYDVEVAYSAPVRVTGGPDVYRVVNLMPYPLHDVLISMPTPEGRRVGRVDFLPAASPASRAAQPANRPAQPPLPAPPQFKGIEKKAAVRRRAVAMPVAFRQQKTGGKDAAPVAAPAAAPAGAGQAAGEPAPDEGVEATMSPALAPDSPDLAAAKQALAAALLRTGLTQPEVDLFMSLNAEPIFTSEEMVVLVRLPSGILEEKTPLMAYPAPTKSVRVPLVLVRNVDPKIKEEIARLAAQLGADDYAQREAAEKRLLELGRLATPAVKALLKSTDLEAVFRAERILLKFNESIEPN